MQKYTNNVQDLFGNAIPSVTVTIKDNPGGGVSTIFSDNAGTAKTNPFTNDSDGEFFFFAANGRYDIELTGPITETNADILLQDSSLTATTLRINTDINTATPPSTETVTGLYQIFDLANNDELARWGYEGSNVLTLRNLMHGGNTSIQGEDAAGATRSYLVGDPDGATFLRGDTSVRVETQPGGALSLLGIAAGRTALYWNAIEKLRTANETAADKISGADVLNAAGVFKPVGLGVVEDDATAFGSGTQLPFNQINAGENIENNETVATNYDTHPSTGSPQTNIPPGVMWFITNTNTGALTIRPGTSVTLRWYDGAGAAAPTGNRTLARAGIATVRKVSDTLYEIWGIGLT